MVCRYSLTPTGIAVENGRAYLARLNRNLANDQVRGRKRRSALRAETERLASEADDAPDQERIVDSLVILARVRDAADAMGEPDGDSAIALAY